jgi:hypothetical protein
MVVFQIYYCRIEGKMSLGITTLSIKCLFVTITINNTKHENAYYIQIKFKLRYAVESC